MFMTDQIYEDLDGAFTIEELMLEKASRLGDPVPPFGTGLTAEAAYFALNSSATPHPPRVPHIIRT